MQLPAGQSQRPRIRLRQALIRSLHHTRVRYGLPDLLHQIFPFLEGESAWLRVYALFQLIQPPFKASEHLPRCLQNACQSRRWLSTDARGS